MLILGAMMR